MEDRERNFVRNNYGKRAGNRDRDPDPAQGVFVEPLLITGLRFEKSVNEYL